MTDDAADDADANGGTGLERLLSVASTPAPERRELLLVAAVLLSLGATTVFVLGDDPLVLRAVVTYLAFVALSLAVTWALDRRYPA